MGDVGSKLKNLRISRNVTQQELADALSVTRNLISHWESGIRNINTNQLIQIAKFFNVTLDYFNDKPEDQQLFETLIQLSNFFQSEGVPDEDKDKAYRDIMQLYLKSKEKGREEQNGNKHTTNAERGSTKISERLEQ